MLGILIPTKNRSEFVIRQLYYYASVQCPYTIYIGDSSDQEHVEKMLVIIEQLKNQISIVYKQYPKLNDSQCIKQLIQINEEKYSTFIGDDDFQIPEGLKQCIQFLENHSDYRTAQGKGLLFSLKQNGAYGEFRSVAPYHLKHEENEIPSQRIVHFLDNYWVPLFSVHRTEEFLDDYENIEKLTDKSFTELMPNCLSIIRGKSKQLDHLQVIRQGHEQRYFLPTQFDWITNKNWQPSYQLFHDTLTDALTIKEETDMESASKSIKQGLNSYLTHVFLKHQCIQRKTIFPSILSAIKIKFKQIPWLKQPYHQIKRKISWSQTEISLPSLLNPSSPYHQDFMPVYRTIASTFFN